MIACICIHGFTGGPYEVEPLADHLKLHTNWYVVTPRMPGHGLDLQLDDVTYEDWIEKIESLYLSIQKHYETIYLVGFSMGGMIAAYLAAKYKSNKLVLLSASRRYISFKQIAIDILGFAKKGLQNTLQDDPLLHHYLRKKGAVPPKATLEFLKCMQFTQPYLKKVYCPVFIAQGIQDGMVPYNAVEYLDREIPVETEIIYYHDSKHLICLGEDKEVVTKAVYKFLKR